MSGNGWCTHPKRQISSDVRILVRKGELACRNSWGGDLWESVGAQEPTPLRKTQIPDSAFVMNERSEDEVTSVRAAHHEPDTSDRVVFSDPSFRQADQEDVIVDHASISRDETSRDIRSTQRHGLADDDGLNTPAQEEQHERAQVIARGSRDAILRARERHTQRRRGTDRIQPRLLSDGAGVPADQEDASQPAWSAEEEPQPTTPLSEFDTPNAVTSEPQHITDPMARRFGRRAHIRQESLGASSSEQSISIAFTRARDDAAPVPPSETPPDPMHLVSRKVDRERFETVPEVKPTIGLPRIREFLQSGDTSPDDQESTTTAEAKPGSVSSYDLVLRRAQAIKSASKTERGARPGRAITTSPAPTAPATFRTVRRERVNHLPQINWDHEPDAGDPPFTAARLPDLETEPVVSGRRERHASSVDLEPVEVRHPDEPDDEWLENGLDDEQTYTGALPEDDHSRSWWRGLNFTRSRREPESPAIEIVDDDDAYEREWIAAGEDADSFADADSFGDPSPPAITAPRESVAARSVQSRPISSAGRGVSRVATQESPGDSSNRQERISASPPLEQSL
ncbi:MAG: hypothetical protein H0W23_01800, partial [Chloroflexia bacterium]|nr:hypothetical protein [Chloroflexia bacterium]